MAELILPASLKPMANRGGEFTGDTLGAALNRLAEESPRIRPYLFDGANLRPFVVVFQNGKAVNRQEVLTAPLAANDQIRIVASVAGG